MKEPGTFIAICDATERRRNGDRIEPVIEFPESLTYPYIKNLTISHGRAAEILGINKYDLIDLYGHLGIPYYDFDLSEIEDEVKTYKKLNFF